MNNGLRTTLGASGVFCVIAALVGGDVKVAGYELPIINDPCIQTALAILGLVLLVIAIRGPRRPRTKTWLVTELGTTITVPGKRTRGNASRTFEVEAASYRKSDDGKIYIFTDRDGNPTRHIPASRVHEIKRKDG